MRNKIFLFLFLWCGVINAQNPLWKLVYGGGIFRLQPVSSAWRIDSTFIGGAGLWLRNATAPESGTLTPATTTDTIKSRYFNATTGYLGGATGTASAPSYGISGQTNAMGMYPVGVGDIGFSVNNTRVFRANTTNFVTDVNVVPNTDGGYNLGSTTLNWNVGFLKSLRVGVGATQNPLHVIVGVTGALGNLNAFNFVDSDVNLNRNTVAEATDSATAYLAFSTTGNPTLTMKDKVGTIQFKSDSSRTYALASRIENTTSDYLDIKWLSNVAYITTNASARPLIIGTDNASALYFRAAGTNYWLVSNVGGHLSPNSNGTVDLGASGSRVRNVYTRLMNTDSSITIGGTGIIAGNSAIRDTAAFSGTETRLAIYISGATSTDYYTVTPRGLAALGGETLPTSNDVLLCAPKTDSLIVLRPASGTSGLKLTYMKMR